MQPTSTLLQAFTYHEKPVRTTMIESEPWFCLLDTGRVLEMKDPTNFLSSEWCESEGVVKFTTPTDSGIQDLTYINERNLYAMVSRSSKKEAKDFMNWLYKEVLPEIRKTGSYRTPLGIDNDPILAALGAIRETRLRQLETERKVEDHESRLSTIEHRQEQTLEAIDALPAPTVEVRELNMREQCREAISRLATAAGISHHDAWTRAYAKFDLVHGVCLTKRIKGTNLSKLDWCEKNGRLDDLYGIICAMAERARTAA